MKLVVPTGLTMSLEMAKKRVLLLGFLPRACDMQQVESHAGDWWSECEESEGIVHME